MRLRQAVLRADVALLRGAERQDLPLVRLMTRWARGGGSFSKGELQPSSFFLLVCLQSDQLIRRASFRVQTLRGDNRLSWLTASMTRGNDGVICAKESRFERLPTCDA